MGRENTDVRGIVGGGDKIAISGDCGERIRIYVRVMWGGDKINVRRDYSKGIKIDVRGIMGDINRCKWGIVGKG